MKLARPAHLPRFSDPAPKHAPASYAEVRNEDAILALDEFRAIEIRGRQYRVPPVPYKDGLRLSRIYARLAKLEGSNTEDKLNAFDAIMTDVRKIAKQLLIPLGVRRWLWWLHIRPDPLRGCTEQEIGAVLGFLQRCRMNAAPRLREAAAARHRASI